MSEEDLFYCNHGKNINGVYLIRDILEKPLLLCQECYNKLRNEMVYNAIADELNKAIRQEVSNIRLN